jgi:phosphatidylinositol alpha-1,6-mannosyltransferase
MYVKLILSAVLLSVRHRFDAVHAGRVLPEGFAAWLAARLTRRPFVVYAHGEEVTTWRQPGKYRAMRFLYRHADVVVVNSEFTGSEVARLGVRRRRIVQIAPGVDTSRFRPHLDGRPIRERLGVGRGTILLLSVGRLSRRKGFDYTIRAVARLVREGVPVVYAIAGRGEDADYLAAVIERERIGKAVFLVGAVSDDELPLWYAAADIFVMANREIDGDTEGFGIVYIEAGACGIPVIAGDAGGTRSAVVDGETGVVVDGDSVEDISRAIRRLVEDEEYRLRLAKVGCERAHRCYSWERVASDTLALHRRLVAGE